MSRQKAAILVCAAAVTVFGLAVMYSHAGRPAIAQDEPADAGEEPDLRIAAPADEPADQAGSVAAEVKVVPRLKPRGPYRQLFVDEAEEEPSPRPAPGKARPRRQIEEEEIEVEAAPRVVPPPRSETEVLRQRYAELAAKRARRLSEDELKQAIEETARALDLQDKSAEAEMNNSIEHLRELIKKFPGTPTAEKATRALRILDGTDAAAPRAPTRAKRRIDE